ncbi:MAG: proline--tRNA ligase [Deltaproteobacteria bacterium]|nr:proline--tRNA ligase [Deltaproteobacteria bacterium]MBW2076049.1 proline--tRNA ligase [Deltaproteobacteria bacterium]RLB32261.1 MAG: proline--tRNA ligase [Deltaproteobacteria bacterium]
MKSSSRRFSEFFIPTLKEVPAEAEIISHQVMLRTGMIRKLAAGIYSYLPYGLMALKKVEDIVREEMNRAGAIELLLPSVQPGELWMESGRWNYYGPELLRFRDRHNRESCLGPTHEEVITDIVRREIHSYKQLPITLYQIQTKFRDEIRPRFGIMRAREFIMKDAYSFDIDEQGCNRSYENMYRAYEAIFRRCGLRFRAVEADTGPIGGSFSHEFMVLSDTGEDEIVSCQRCSYASNLEKAEVVEQGEKSSVSEEERVFQVVDTPEVRTIEELTSFLSIGPENVVKTLIYQTESEPIALLVRGDHSLNETKAKNALNAEELTMADPDTVLEVTGAPMGFAGAMGLKVKVLADLSLKGMKNMVMGANEEDRHVLNVNEGRDFRVDQYADLRMITPEDPCPRCGGSLQFGKGIEVGHVFKLGAKYSNALKANFLNEHGHETPVIMGCYGIGIGRTVAAAIEQCHDENGIIFPISISPFEVIILPLELHESRVREVADQLYGQLSDNGLSVFLDDRDERPGYKFKDADLLGTPVRITVSTRTLRKESVEIKLRSSPELNLIPLLEAATVIRKTVQSLYDSLK